MSLDHKDLDLEDFESEALVGAFLLEYGITIFLEDRFYGFAWEHGVIGTGPPERLGLATAEHFAAIFAWMWLGRKADIGDICQEAYKIAYDCGLLRGATP